MIVSLLRALIAWIMLCAEIMLLPALDHVMPGSWPGEQPRRAGGELWLTNGCIQAMLIWTLFNDSNSTTLVLLATSLILLPYLWSAAHQVLLAVRGETYGNGRVAPRPGHRSRPGVRDLAGLRRRCRVPADRRFSLLGSILCVWARRSLPLHPGRMGHLRRRGSAAVWAIIAIRNGDLSIG